VIVILIIMTLSSHSLFSLFVFMASVASSFFSPEQISEDIALFALKPTAEKRDMLVGIYKTLATRVREWWEIADLILARGDDDAFLGEAYRDFISISSYAYAQEQEQIARLASKSAEVRNRVSATENEPTETITDEQWV
jgi:hypothetical protein